MLKVVVGHSEDVREIDAANEVVKQIKASLGELQPQSGVLFCSVDFDHALVLSVIRAVFPTMELVGCTTDGELSSVLGFIEDSLSLMVFASDTIEMHAGVGRALVGRGVEAGREAAMVARQGLNRKAGEERFAIIIADSFNVGVSGVEAGIQEVFGNDFPIIGGAAAAHSKQRRTFQFYNDEVLTNSVVVLLFAGPVIFSHGMKGGLIPMGSKELVTQCKDNVLYRIGDRPAIEYFRKYIGNYDLFMNYCLAVYEEGCDNFYVRSAPSSDPENGTVTLNGLVPQGSMIQIGLIDRDTLIQSCNESIYRALDSYPGGHPDAALFFSCAGRKMLMGTQITREVQAVQKQLPDIPFVGFYCYGEFGPLTVGSKCMFHGATFIALLLGESEVR